MHKTVHSALTGGVLAAAAFVWSQPLAVIPLVVAGAILLVTHPTIRDFIFGTK